MKIVILDAYCVNPGDLSWDELRRFGESASAYVPPAVLAALDACEK